MFIILQGCHMPIWEMFQITQAIFNLFLNFPLVLSSLLSGLAGTLLVCVVLSLRINKQLIISNSGDTGSSCKMVETLQWPVMLWGYSLARSLRLHRFLFTCIPQHNSSLAVVSQLWKKTQGSGDISLEHAATRCPDKAGQRQTVPSGACSVLSHSH